MAGLVNIVRCARTFTAKNDDVLCLKRKVLQWLGGMGRGQNQPVACAGLDKSRPVHVAFEFRIGTVIHARAAQLSVVQQEPAGLDDMKLEIEAGAKSHDGARILRNIGLKERD